MKLKPSKLFQICVKRDAMKWDEPHRRADTLEGVIEAIREAAATPFKTIEIEDVSHWNSPQSTHVTMCRCCPQ